MNKAEEFIKIFTGLGLVFGKEFTKEQISVWFEFLKDIEPEHIKMAVAKIIKTKKFMPTVAEIRETAEEIATDNKHKIANEIIERMKQDNYFKSPNEIDKTIKWVQEGNIPGWLKEDMKKYSQEKITFETKALTYE